MGDLEKRFKVSVTDIEDFEAVIKSFNERYETDFYIKSVDIKCDGAFIFVAFSNATLDDVFLLGSNHEGSCFRRKKRSQ